MKIEITGNDNGAWNLIATGDDDPMPLYAAYGRSPWAIKALVHAGNHKQGLADEYRLIIDAPKHAHLDIPEGAEYRQIVDDVNGANKSAQKGRRMRVQRSPKASADATESDETSALTMASANDDYQRSLEAPLALIHGEPPPYKDHLVSEVRPSTGGAPPPDPRRRPPPPASANESRNSLNGPPPYEPGRHHQHPRRRHTTRQGDDQ